MLWECLTWQQIAEQVANGMTLAVLPIGATEQHGPHLPCGVDSVSAATVAAEASARCGAFVLPTLPYGCSLGHSRHWPGTISLRPGHLTDLVVDIADWVRASGITKLILLNGHYTNVAPLRCALEEIRDRFADLQIASISLWDLSPAIHERYHADGANWHANQAETALYMHWQPDLVYPELIEDAPDPSAGWQFSYTVDRETPNGVVGLPSRADAGQGAELAELLAAALAQRCVASLAEAPPPVLASGVSV